MRSQAYKDPGESPNGNFRNHSRLVGSWKRFGKRGSKSVPTWRTSGSVKVGRRPGSRSFGDKTDCVVRKWPVECGSLLPLFDCVIRKKAGASSRTPVDRFQSYRYLR